MSYWIRYKDTKRSIIEGYLNSFQEAQNKYYQLTKKNKRLIGKIGIYNFSGDLLFG